jgi:hypothetical protein
MPADTLTVGLRNRQFGWTLFLVGIVYGMALGLFAFDGPLAAPARFADYGSTPRRLIRLAHIACMALGIVNAVYGQEIDRTALGQRARWIGSRTMMLAGVLMPLFLTAGAFQATWKWGLPLPSLAALVGTGILVVGVTRHCAHGPWAQGPGPKELS